MKKLFLTIVMLCVSLSAFSQEANTNTGSAKKQGAKKSFVGSFMYRQAEADWKIKLRAGINYSTLYTSGSESEDFDCRVGYEFGAVVHRAWKKFVFEPGAYFTSVGAKDLRLNYVEIPLKAGWIFWRPKMAATGWWSAVNVAPYGAVGVAGKYKSDGEKHSVKFGKNKMGDRFDYGLRFSLNLNLSSFNFEAGYRLGLNDISNMSGQKMYNRGFFFSTGLSFGD